MLIPILGLIDFRHGVAINLGDVEHRAMANERDELGIALLRVAVRDFKTLVEEDLYLDSQ